MPPPASYLCWGSAYLWIAAQAGTVDAMARLRPHPGASVTFEEFLDTPGPAVALDGYVRGPSRWDLHHASFDHHEGCSRFTTRATCEQVALAIRSHCPVLVDEQGRSRPELTVHVNDDDPDVALSWWLCTHPQEVGNPKLDRLLVLEGVLDASGGMLRAGAVDELQQLAWVIEPWVEARHRGPRDEAACRGVVEAVADRITAMVAGRAGQVTHANQYDVLARRGTVWAVREHHPLARCQVVADGATAIVAVRSTGNGSMDYSLALADPWSAPALTPLYAALDRLEGRDEGHGWGGSDTVGGSPRGSGSSLPVDVVVEHLAQHLSAEA